MKSRREGLGNSCPLGMIGSFSVGREDGKQWEEATDVAAHTIVDQPCSGKPPRAKRPNRTGTHAEDQVQGRSGRVGLELCLPLIRYSPDFSHDAVIWRWRPSVTPLLRQFWKNICFLCQDSGFGGLLGVWRNEFSRLGQKESAFAAWTAAFAAVGTSTLGEQLSCVDSSVRSSC